VIALTHVAFERYLIILHTGDAKKEKMREMKDAGERYDALFMPLLQLSPTSPITSALFFSRTSLRLLRLSIVTRITHIGQCFEIL
jgi:hypothetical protein